MHSQPPRDQSIDRFTYRASIRIVGLPGIDQQCAGIAEEQVQEWNLVGGHLALTWYESVLVMAMHLKRWLGVCAASALRGEIPKSQWTFKDPDDVGAPAAKSRGSVRESAGTRTVSPIKREDAQVDHMKTISVLCGATNPPGRSRGISDYDRTYDHPGARQRVSHLSPSARDTPRRSVQLTGVSVSTR
jgi:hypothetical protein